MKVIGIGGGSGSGKSTLCYSLMDTYSETFSIIHLDDYQKHKNDPTIPKSAGVINWDHPDTINWSALLSDIAKLKEGESVAISSWSHRDNVDYFAHGKMMDYTIYPKSLILLEGYLALWNAELLQMYDRTYFLEADQDIRMARRDKFADPLYEEKILTPMHNEYVEPSKQNADVVIDVSASDAVAVHESVKDDLDEVFKFIS
ncbi:MAG: uridine kinase [Candidatus Azotimanducaceae bacterium]|jgi:uridine kinase